MIGGMIEPYSAGIETHRPDPLAVKVMAEAGVKPESEAGKAGLREGIIITSVKHQGGRINITPSSADYFEKIVENLTAGEPVEFMVWRRSEGSWHQDYVTFKVKEEKPGQAKGMNQGGCVSWTLARAAVLTASWPHARLDRAGGLSGWT